MSSNSDPPTVPTRRDISKTLSATKNLRAISMSLVKKLRSSEGMSSVDIASELASEAVREVEGASFVVSEEELQAVGKNIRRRLYDSLKVLESVGAIERTKKDKTLTWLGTNHLIPQQFQANSSSDSDNPSPDAAALSRSVAHLRKSMADKHTELSQLEAKWRAVINLCRRNQRSPGPEPVRIELPFVIIRTPVTTDIKLDATPDARSMTFEFHGHYEIVNDTCILDRMFLVTDAATAANQPPRADSGDVVARVSDPQPAANVFQRQAGVDPFSSPKRRRVASKSPFAKFTSGSKPPISPGTPLRQEALARRQRVSTYTSPIQSGIRITPNNADEYPSPYLSSPRKTICAPPRKRIYDSRSIHSDSTQGDADAAAGTKKGFLRRTYGPLHHGGNVDSGSVECEALKSHTSTELTRTW